jgi:hypothetical protein
MIALSGKIQSENFDSYKMLLSLVFVLMFREKFSSYKLNEKVKVTPEQATKAQRGSRGIAVFFH